MKKRRRKGDFVMKCPKCGEEMEKGTLRAGSGGGATSVYWVQWGIGEKKTERISSGLIQVELKGFRCTKCKIVLISYEKEQNNG
jgi:transcription initiation factor IIE alpha subunit